MLGMVDWLNRTSPFDRALLRWPTTLLAVLVAVALAVVAFRAARRGRVEWIAVVSAATLGVTLGGASAATLHRMAMPQPQPVRPLTRVVVDRTVSDVPLSLGAYTEGDGSGYGLFEQWIPRLGCYTQRARGAEAFEGDALVVICPNPKCHQGVPRQAWSSTWPAAASCW